MLKLSKSKEKSPSLSACYILILMESYLLQWKHFVKSLQSKQHCIVFIQVKDGALKVRYKTLPKVFSPLILLCVKKKGCSLLMTWRKNAGFAVKKFQRTKEANCSVWRGKSHKIWTNLWGPSDKETISQEVHWRKCQIPAFTEFPSWDFPAVGTASDKCWGLVRTMDCGAGCSQGCWSHWEVYLKSWWRRQQRQWENIFLISLISEQQYSWSPVTVKIFLVLEWLIVHEDESQTWNV